MQNEKVYNCWKCGSTFKQGVSLSRHIKEVHERNYRFECPLCKTHFKRKGDCKRHIYRRHKGGEMALENLRPNVVKLEVADDDNEYCMKRLPDTFENSGEYIETVDSQSDDFNVHRVNKILSSVISETVRETPRNREGETRRLSSGLDLETKEFDTYKNENLCVIKKVKVTKYPSGKTVTVTTFFRHCKSNDSGYGSCSPQMSSEDEH